MRRFRRARRGVKGLKFLPLFGSIPLAETSHLTIAETETIEEAFRRLNANRLGILFAQDPGGRIVGAVTDGDIRRRMLTGITIHDRVATCVNRSFVWAHAGGPREQ